MPTTFSLAGGLLLSQFLPPRALAASAYVPRGEAPPGHARIVYCHYERMSNGGAGESVALGEDAVSEFWGGYSSPTGLSIWCLTGPGTATRIGPGAGGG